MSYFQVLNHICTIYNFGDNWVYSRLRILTKSPGF
uniref:Uncharacterized protein n=1 Tax=Anguilla anguilla TaxID=7936 RepID=A0A0E9R917_ANGAN